MHRFMRYFMPCCHQAQESASSPGSRLEGLIVRFQTSQLVPTLAHMFTPSGRAMRAVMALTLLSFVSPSYGSH